MNSKGFIKGAICLLAAILVLTAGAGWAQTIQTSGKKINVHEQMFDNEQIFGNKVGMQEKNYGSPPFDNPNYYYAAVKTAPSGVWYRQAGLSPNGQKIVAQKSYTDGAISRTEIVLMNANGTGETIISAGNSGQGDIYGYMNPFWSDDGSAIGYAEVHNSNPNKIVRYVISSGTTSYIYEPSTPLDATNADFLGNSTTSIVFWDWIAADGAADLFIWNGTTRTNITNSTNYSEYEPVSNGDGTVILYWSGETTAELVNTTHTLTYSGGVWTKDVGFTPITDSYWSYWSTRSDNYIGVTVMSSKDVHLYTSTGTFVLDLTGTGYSGGSGQWNFFGTGFEGPNGEMLMTSNAGRADPGRDIIFAAPRANLYVNAATGSDSYPGTEYAPFLTIQKAIDEASSSIVHVAAGTYGADPVTGKGAYITKNGLSLIGESETGTIIDGAIGGVGSSGSYWPSGIHVQANNVTIKNFTIQGFNGDGTTTGGYGVLHRDFAHDTPGEGYIFYDGCTVDNVTVQSCYSAIYALCFTHLTVKNCMVSNNGADGMFIARGSDYATIYDNTVTNSGDHGIWVGICWMGLRPSHHAKIYKNRVDGAQEGGISFVASNDAEIYDNTITNAAGEDPAVGGWSVGALSLKDGPSNVTAYRNLIYNNSGTWNGYNGTGNGVGVDGSASNINLHHNRIYGNSGYACRRYSTSIVLAENNWWGSVDGPQDLLGSSEVPPCGDVSTMQNIVAEISGTLGNKVSENVDYCPWVGVDAGFDAEIYAGCNDPCDDFSLDFKLSGTNIRFFHFEYPLPTCIVKDAIHNTYGSGLVTFQATMFGNVLHIDGNFDPNFTGTNVKLGDIHFHHNGSCPDMVKTLICTAYEVRDGNGNLVNVIPGQAIINLDNTEPTKDHPTDPILPCYSAPDDPDWACWNLAFHKGSEEWQCKLLQATIRIYKASLCGSGDLVFTHDFFTTPQPGDFSICYPTNQADRNAIWNAIYPTYGDRTYYVRLTVKDSCCNEADNCDAFTFCTDTHTDNYMTCVDAKPAHNHICLEWNYTYDATNAVKLRILRSPYRVGNYPEYAASNPVPSGYNDASWYKVYEGKATYPCDGATWFQDDGQGCNGGGSFFANNTRDIYWYAGFTQDTAGNWSSPNMAVGIGADRATSYWLGDVTDIWGIVGPDGWVFGFTGDVGRLSSAYGTSPPSDNTVDYGPETQEHGIGRGIPTPDDVINWRDLLPFSYNYNIVGPSGSCTNWPLLAQNQPARQLNKSAQEISVWLEQVGSNQHGGVTFALMLTNPGDAIHLFHTQISYNSSALSLKGVRRGEVRITEGSAEFFAHPVTGDGQVDVDLAALGPDAYVVGSGAVAYLDFSYKATEIPSKIGLKEAILYDGEGNEINLSPTDVEVGNQGEAIPTEFALYYNHPNPFNPTTTIKYDLPQASYVKLVVYNVMGQNVVTLIDGMVEAGRHQVIWDAKDLSSGVYFYKITAGNFTQMHKMILLK